MKPAPLAYRRPVTVDQACDLLATHADAKVLAGGQSLIPLLNMRLAAPRLLIDINRLPGLDTVSETDGGVMVGALVRHADLLADPVALRVQPLLGMALSQVAHATIRNRGTTVGSLVHADAAAEMPVVLALLDGWLEVRSVRGTRRIPAGELVVGPLESSLAHDEIAVAAWFAGLRPGEGVAFEEISRRHGDYALCGVAARVRIEGDRLVQARAGYLSMSEVPTVVDLTNSLAGRLDADEASWSDAGEVAVSALDPMDDIHASADYRAHLARVLTRRVISAACAHARAREGR